MKFVVQWTARPGQTIADGENSMKVFSKWTPDPSVTFHQFVTRADGQGGFAVLETDDARHLLRDAGLFSPWLEFSAYPVVDMLDAAPIQQEILDTLTGL